MLYTMALKGIFPSNDHSKRQELLDAADGLAYVKEKLGITHGKKEVICGCVQFRKGASCQHAALSFQVEFSRIAHISQTKKENIITIQGEHHLTLLSSGIGGSIITPKSGVIK
jgi:hypothetical protein